MLLRTVKPCGSGTRCWCQVGEGFAGPTGFGRTVNSLAMVTRRIRRQGERGASRKAIAQGMSDAYAEPVCSCALYLYPFCTRDRGCSAHPAFPAPSKGEDISKPRAHWRGEDEGVLQWYRHCLRQTRSVCAREQRDEAIQLSWLQAQAGLLRSARN